MDDRQPLLKESALPHGGIAGTIKLVLICGGGGRFGHQACVCRNRNKFEFREMLCLCNKLDFVILTKINLDLYFRNTSILLKCLNTVV